MVAPINSVKHYVPRPNVSLASGAGQGNVVVDAVVAPATAAASDVKEGAVVKAVHLEYWLWGGGTTGVDTQFVIVVEKTPSGGTAIGAAQMLNMGAYQNKKNILYQSQGVIGAGVDGSQAIPVIRDWLLIPKGKQRFGFGDRLVVSFTTVGSAIQICGQATYKEYI